MSKREKQFQSGPIAEMRQGIAIRRFSVRPLDLRFLEGRWKMSSEEEKRPWWEVWKRWRRQSEEEKSPDELKREWDAYRRVFDEAWLTLPDASQATGTFANEFLDSYRDVLESSQIRKLEAIRDAARAIAEVPEEQGWKLVTAQLGQLTDISRQLLNSQRVTEGQGQERGLEVLAAFGGDDCHCYRGLGKGIAP